MSLALLPFDSGGAAGGLGESQRGEEGVDEDVSEVRDGAAEVGGRKGRLGSGGGAEEGGENVAVVGRNGGVGYAEEVGLHEVLEAGDGSGVVRGGERGGGGRGGESGIVLGGGEGGEGGKSLG